MPIKQPLTQFKLTDCVAPTFTVTLYLPSGIRVREVPVSFVCTAAHKGANGSGERDEEHKGSLVCLHHRNVSMRALTCVVLCLSHWSVCQQRGLTEKDAKQQAQNLKEKLQGYVRHFQEKHASGSSTSSCECFLALTPSVNRVAYCAWKSEGSEKL